MCYTDYWLVAMRLADARYARLRKAAAEKAKRAKIKEAKIRELSDRETSTVLHQVPATVTAKKLALA